ncbi:MAG: hypothetical protein BGO31_14145 [Bacteroidetes bacterium 43-16]|nr:MAG: hypothetical protein BGO31_14145 [Bacteroidetes bacterium 43-16]
MPQSGCKVRKIYKEQIKINAKLIKDRDSLRVSMSDSMRTLSLVRNTLAETVSRMDKMSAERRAENLTIEKKTVPNPVTVTGKTYKTSIPGNWMLDTSGIKDGKLIYFDMDNDDVRATAYYQAGQMRVEIQTKDKTVDVPAEEIRITKSSEATKSTADKSLKEEKVITAEDLKEVAQGSKSDSSHINDSERSELKAEQINEGSKSTRPTWLTIAIIIASALIAVALIWHFSLIGKTVEWVRRIINKIKSK